MKKYLLLVDDDEEEMEIFSEALQQMQSNYKCMYANGASQALQLLDYIKPAMIFVDLNMPRVNGIDCIRLLRTIPCVKNKPIVLYSTDADEQTGMYAQMYGATTHIKKTYTKENLTGVLQKLFQTYLPD